MDAYVSPSEPMPTGQPSFAVFRPARNPDPGPNGVYVIVWRHTNSDSGSPLRPDIGLLLDADYGIVVDELGQPFSTEPAYWAWIPHPDGFAMNSSAPPAELP